MATHFAAGAPQQAGTMPPQHASTSPIPPHWYEQQPKQGLGTSAASGVAGEGRSVTPAMNNTRGAVLNIPNYPSRVPSPGPPTSGIQGQSAVGAHYNNRATTPQRYYGAYNVPDEGVQLSQQPPQQHQHQHQQQQQQQQPPPQQSNPSSTGLIRLTLRKPMGIVFEPMYDPNQPSVQRGVRICDLPRTGAAALSRKLEVGDELLSINDKTMSRLTFDEIMDFIIEADPEQVNLLFRRPRRENLVTRNHPVKPMHGHTSTTVKWIDDDERKKKDKSKSSKPVKSKRSTKKDEDDTIQSTEESAEPTRGRKKSRARKGEPYENETFLDLLIDAICANPDNVCRSRRNDDEYYSDDEGTLTSQDDSTCITYESDKKASEKKKKSKGQNRDDDSSAVYETEEDTLTEEDDRKRRKKGSRNAPKESRRDEAPKQRRKYDDETLETIETSERPKPEETATPAPAPAPLGLAPSPPAEVVPPVQLPVVPAPVAEEPRVVQLEEEETNPAPISTVEYDEQIDHGADVSVMESLGGPSLLIEKQRQAAAAAAKNAVENAVSPEIMSNFGLDYPSGYGLTREQTILNDPIKFYTFVVRGLLEEHEPEKVRLLDKLLAKYKGREDHLVQKLSVRYERSSEPKAEEVPEPENNGKTFGTFTDAVNTNRETDATARVVESAKERAVATYTWPEKETKEIEPQDGEKEADEGEDESASGSEYSGDSIDGTSPAVIAQVSELLNYVYGKTSVPGQIDRVSTIMRAYEGREAVLLELLETKALIKANSEKENAANLPSFLRNSPALQHPIEEQAPDNEVSELSSPNMQNTQPAGGNIISDDISSMSGVSSPANEVHNARKPSLDDQPARAQSSSARQISEPVVRKVTAHIEPRRIHEQSRPSRPSKQLSSGPTATAKPSNAMMRAPSDRGDPSKKKKKGFLGGLFKKNKKSKDKVASPRGARGMRSDLNMQGSI